MNLNNDQQIKKFWENCPEYFAHTKKNYQALVRGWKKAFLLGKTSCFIVMTRSE